jgi:hypothetical protein
MSQKVPRKVEKLSKRYRSSTPNTGPRKAKKVEIGKKLAMAKRELNICLSTLRNQNSKAKAEYFDSCHRDFHPSNPAHSLNKHIKCID